MDQVIALSGGGEGGLGGGWVGATLGAAGDVEGLARREERGELSASQAKHLKPSAKSLVDASDDLANEPSPEEIAKWWRGLAARGVLVKVNSVVIPGVNDGHIVEVAAIIRIVVDLPAPFGPRKPKICPPGMARSTPWSTGTCAWSRR